MYVCMNVCMYVCIYICAYMYACNVVSISASGLKHEFTFDTIYQSDSTQHQVFETAAVPIVKAATEGYNGTNTHLNK